MPGVVLGVDRGRSACWVDGRHVTAVRARELGRRGAVVGDRVAVVGDTSGETDALARIVRVEPRTTVLRRTADDTDPVERVVVANAEVLVVVTALADPEPRPRFLDRALVAAFAGGLEPLLCLTKADLGDAAALREAYGELGVDAVQTRPGDGDEGVAELRRRLAGRTSVLLGMSGVGKSTLVNRLVPGADRAVGVVNAVTGRGRHTSSSAIALPHPDGGWVVDTPGIRSFGLAHVTAAEIVAAFDDVATAAADCPPGCAHAEGTAGCALDVHAAAGRLPAARVDSIRRLLAARVADED